MFATTHVLSGAVIGRHVRNPVAAFGLGVISHLALDALPHWGMNISTKRGYRTFLGIAAIDGLTLSALLAQMIRQGRPASEITGSLGALLLDMDKPMWLLGVDQLWPDLLHDVHIGIQTHESPRRWPVDVAVAMVCLVVIGSE